MPGDADLPPFGGRWERERIKEASTCLNRGFLAYCTENGRADQNGAR